MTNEQLITKLSSLPKNYKIMRGFTEDEMYGEELLVNESVPIKKVYRSDARKEIRLI